MSVVYKKITGTTSDGFTIGRRGVTLHPSHDDPANNGNVKSSDIWVDMASNSIRFRDSSNAAWKLQTFDDIEIEQSTLTVGQDLFVTSSGTGSLIVNNSTDTAKIKTNDENHLLISGGDTDTNVGGDLILSPGIPRGAGTPGKLIFNGTQWPSVTGVDKQVLISDESGILSWGNVSFSSIGGKVDTELPNAKTVVYDSATEEWTTTDTVGGPSTPQEMEVITSDQSITVAKKYFINGAHTVTLPDHTLASIVVGSYVEILTKSNATAIINTFTGQSILLQDGSTTNTITHDTVSILTLIYDGTDWSMAM